MRLATLIVLSFCLLSHVASASHIYGADFFYSYVSGTQYRVTLVIYGDCDGEYFKHLEGASPTIVLYDGPTIVTSRNLVQEGPGIEVTPVCATELGNTSCKNATNPIQGVTSYTFSGIFNISYASANWRFHFGGALPHPTGAGAAGRSYDLSNIRNSATATSVMALDARLNNLSGPNSTPRFTTIPTPFYCINVPQQYNHGAIDPNLDSLSYAMVPGMERAGAFVKYVSPYSGGTPMNGAAGNWSFSASTGQLDFTPTLANKYLVVNEVKEYRKGVLVGTSTREMSFVILSNCNNRPSVSRLDSSANSRSGVRFRNGEIIICENRDTARFTINALNAAGDTVTASVSGLPPGVRATIHGNGTASPRVVVDWFNAALAPGMYNFYVTYKDNGCPLTSSQTKAFTIRVVAPNRLDGPNVVVPTQCFRKAVLRFALDGGLLPRTVTITQGGNVAIRYRDLTGLPFIDSLYAGTYAVDISSDDLDCSTQRSITVVDSGDYPNAPVARDLYHCLGDSPLPLRPTKDSATSLLWYAADGSPLPDAPVIATDVPGRWLYLVSQRRRICESARDSMMVYVTHRPVATIIGSQELCEFDTSTYTFTGSVGQGPVIEYKWSWGNAFYRVGDGPGPWKLIWGIEGRKYVTLQVIENHCASFIDTLEVNVKPKPFSGFDVDGEACRMDTVRIEYNTRPLANQEFAWSFTGATLKNASSAGPFTITWDTPGIKRISLTTSIKGCLDTRFSDITIHPTPTLSIGNTAGPVCIGDKIYLQAGGADRYSWRPADSLRSDENGLYAQILKPSRYTVTGVNEWRCKDSAHIDYPVVEPCCSFGYPNAFTPNGDGRNDRFSAVSYGNHLEYNLSIYNRWGQRVYYGHHAAQGWDGSYGGKPCDAGTYYYHLNALCFTGHREVRSGDLILIR